MSKFKMGDKVRKVSGSQWHGTVVGTYSTELTPEGYAVESSTEKGSVQIYPAKALEAFGEIAWSNNSQWQADRAKVAITALRQALEQPNEFHPDWDQIKPFHDRIAELEKVVRQALGALEGVVHAHGYKGGTPVEAITALRRALSATHGEQPAQQEPVAWLFTNVQSGDWDFCYQEDEHDDDMEMWHKQPLYAHPQVIDKSAATRIATALGWEPKREWVGLTMEDKKRILESDFGGSRLDCMDEAEKILKEKNT